MATIEIRCNCKLKVYIQQDLVDLECYILQFIGFTETLHVHTKKNKNHDWGKICKKKRTQIFFFLK